MDLENIKTDFEDYREKQAYFKILNQKKKKGKLVHASRTETVSGKFIGVTYKKKEKED